MQRKKVYNIYTGKNKNIKYINNFMENKRRIINFYIKTINPQLEQETEIGRIVCVFLDDVRKYQIDFMFLFFLGDIDKTKLNYRI